MVFNSPIENIRDDILYNKKRLHSKMVKFMCSSGRVTITFFFMWFELYSSPYERWPGDCRREFTSTFSQLQWSSQVLKTSEFVVLPTELSTLRVSTW